MYDMLFTLQWLYKYKLARHFMIAKLWFSCSKPYSVAQFIIMYSHAYCIHLSVGGIPKSDAPQMVKQ